LETEKKKKKTD